MLDTFNQALGDSKALEELRTGVAQHLSNSMPQTLGADDISIRTASDPDASVLDGVAMFLRRNGNHISLADQSDGIRQLIAMTLFDLAEGSANVIAIDEPEIHLHPSSQRTVTRQTR